MNKVEQDPALTEVLVWRKETVHNLTKNNNSEPGTKKKKKIEFGNREQQDVLEGDGGPKEGGSRV